MTRKEKSWQIANSLCANALLGGTVNWGMMTTILREALQAAEAEAYQRGVAEEREACAKQIESFRVGGPTPETITYIGEALAASIRARGTP